MDTRSTFNILDHIEKLEQAKGKGRYVCPACQGNNFTIGKNGAYQCWSGCLNEDIREALAPWGERGKLLGSGRTIPRRVKSKSPKLMPPVPLPDKLVLAALPEPPTDIPQKQRRLDRERGETWELLYRYSKGQEVVRTESTDNSKSKGYAKTVIPYHLDSEGKFRKGKGSQPWPLYREDEALLYGVGKWVVLPEGEPCVEVCRWLQLVGVTFQGSDWSIETIADRLLMLHQAGIAGVLYLPDNDAPGREKALKVEAAAAAGMPLLVIPPLALWDDMPEKGDIADWVKWGLEQGMNREDFIKQLERAFHGAANERIEVSSNRTSDASLRADFDEGASDTEHIPGFDKSDWVNPESPVAGTVESLTLNTLFEGGNGKAITIDDTFYEDTGKGFWSKRPDNVILKAVAHKIQRAFTLKKSKEKITRIFSFGTDAKLKSCFMFCRKALDVGEMPANRHLRAFSNCTVDLRSGESMPHDRNHFLTTAVAADYHPDQPCPEVFRRFVNSAYGLEQLDAIRAYTSMLLDPTAPYGFFVHLMGPSGSGKGTLLRLWGEMFSLDHFRSGDFSNLATAEARHQYLTSAALFVVPDVGGYVQGLKPFYELVDNGPMAGRALFSSHGYQKKWDTRYVVASVDHLQIENSGDGWDRRCRPLLTKARRGIEDPELGTKLAEVKGEIISWALAMPKSERDRLLLCPSTNEQIQQHKLDAAVQGDPVRAFIDLCFRPDTDATPIHTHQLHSWFKVFAESHGYSNWGMSKLGSHLKTIIPNHFSPRRRATAESDPTRGMISSHWFNLKPLPGAFVDISDVGEGSSSTAKPEGSHEPIWRCVKAFCREGGLVAFQDFQKNGSPNRPDGSANPIDFIKVADLTESVIEQCLQSDGSVGSGGSHRGVGNLEEFQVEIKMETASSLVAQSPSTPSPVALLHALPDPWLETIDTTSPRVDQASKLVIDPHLGPEPKVPDPLPEDVTSTPTGLAPSEVAAFILQCSAWVQIVERLDNVATKLVLTRAVVFNAALKLLDFENRQHLVKLLAEHIKEYPRDTWAYSWLPSSCQKLRGRALDLINSTPDEVQKTSRVFGRTRSSQQEN